MRVSLIVLFFAALGCAKPEPGIECKRFLSLYEGHCLTSADPLKECADHKKRYQEVSSSGGNEALCEVDANQISNAAKDREQTKELRDKLLR